MRSRFSLKTILSAGLITAVAIPFAAQAEEEEQIEEVVVTNTIPLPANVNAGTRKVRQVSVGKLLAQAIKCIHTGDSVKSLFEWSQGASLLA